jgi:hypothetical protein
MIGSLSEVEIDGPLARGASSYVFTATHRTTKLKLVWRCLTIQAAKVVKT